MLYPARPTSDSAHRLNSAVGLESYPYDGTGRRARTVNSTTGTIEYFGYGQDGRLLQDWSNRRNVRNGYIYLGNTLVGLYEVTLSTGAVASRYKHTDALGSPVVTTDAAKAVLSRASYTPYGVPTLPVDGVGYTGHFIDVNTSLTYMQQRYYDPQIGRFLSIDPVEVDTSSAFNFNRYNYALNNPYRFTDPDGRWASQKGFYVHQRATFLVFGKNLPERDRKTLAQAHVLADSKQFQGAESAYRHAMSSPDQSMSEARDKANQFVRDE